MTPQTRPLRILVVTNLYPSPAHPAFGTFVAARVAALVRAGALVDVAAISQATPHQGLARKYIGLALAAAWRSLRALVSRRRYDIVEAHIAFPTGLLAWPIAIVHRARLVLFVHGADVLSVARRTRIHLFLFRALFERARAVVVNSEFMRGKTEEVVGRADHRIVVISPGIDLGLFMGSDTASRDGLLFVGRLDPDKGVGTLLEAMVLLSQGGVHQRLVVIGSGTQSDALRRRAADLGLPVRFDGPLPPADVAMAMRSSRVVVMPSEREPLGLVALEAMAAGAIVVATSVGGLRETVIDGRTGLLVEPSSPVELANGIRRALAIDVDPPARARIVAEARAMAAEHAVPRSVESTVALYRQVMAAAS